VKAEPGGAFRKSNERDLQIRFRFGRDRQSRVGLGWGVQEEKCGTGPG
jgi:hypothetical protein